MKTADKVQWGPCKPGGYGSARVLLNRYRPTSESMSYEIGFTKEGTLVVRDVCGTAEIELGNFRDLAP